jgi:hypothetical protein
MSTCREPRPTDNVPLYSTVFSKLKFKPKIKFKASIELQHLLNKIDGLPLNTYFFLFIPAHTRLNHQIPKLYLSLSPK